MANDKDRSVLDILDAARKSEETGRNISTAALLWAASSVVAVVMQWRGWLVSSYEDALPAVILVTWVGSEIASRLPARTPIAVCGQCGRACVLPRRPLRRLWPWKRCTYCGGRLNFSCPDGHMLSLFADEPLAVSLKSKANSDPYQISSIWCSRCGQLSGKLSIEEFRNRLNLLTADVPEDISYGEVKTWILRLADGRNGFSEVRKELSKEPRRRIALEDDV